MIGGRLLAASLGEVLINVFEQFHSAIEAIGGNVARPFDVPRHSVGVADDKRAYRMPRMPEPGFPRRPVTATNDGKSNSGSPSSFATTEPNVGYFTAAVGIYPVCS